MPLRLFPNLHGHTRWNIKQKLIANNEYAALSRTQLRYERLRLAQKALLEVEEKANQRRERERQEMEELEVMQQEFQKLLASEATMVEFSFPFFSYK